MITRILVPLDMSELAERALVQAAELAKRPHAAIRLVSAWNPLPPAGTDLAPVMIANADETLRADRLAYLERMSAWLRDGMGVDVDVALHTGTPVAVIVREVREWGADLVVMTTHGRTGWSRAWLGSVADAVIRHVEVPVFLVRPMNADGTPYHPTTARTVLVPVDDRGEEERMLRDAVEVIGEGARYELLHVVSPGVAAAEVAEIATPLPQPDDVATREVAREWRERLLAAAARLRAEHMALSVEVRVTIDELPPRAIIAAADHCDIVALQTHARGVSRWLIGSVTDKVLRGTMARVLALPARVAPHGVTMSATSVADAAPLVRR